MEIEGSKICVNCKRDIPMVNFIVHSVHCARNISICPTCKEPVCNTDLQKHHEQMHKLRACKQCGERVCGSDMEDHVRDSCALTVRPCRYCSLELARSELPQHEAYCGSRTELCPECREYVMLKYRQLHQDSNHGFIQLDDEPVHLRPKVELPKSFNIARSLGSQAPSPNTTNTPLAIEPRPISYLKPVPNTPKCPTEIPRSSERLRSSDHQGRQLMAGGSGVSEERFPGQSTSNGHPPAKRTNDRPQVNTSVAATKNFTKESSSLSRGAIRKRTAPSPPAAAPAPAPTPAAPPATPAPHNPLRDRALNSAISRHQQEERLRLEQNAYNLAHGLPAVLTAAEKLERLRKMDALHHRDVQPEEYRHRLRGQCWGTGDLGPHGHVLGSVAPPHGQGTGPGSAGTAAGSVPTATELAATADNGYRPGDNIDLSNLTPMTQSEFMNRFQELQLAAEGRADRERRREEKRQKRRSDDSKYKRSEGDRFSDIKTSLRELRRDLNEVTAPYSDPATNRGCGCGESRLRPGGSRSAERSRSRGCGCGCGDGAQTKRRLSPNGAASSVSGGEGGGGGGAGDAGRGEDEGEGKGEGEGEVRLPCEFCDALVPADELVLHQTGCRPDLTSRSPTPSSALPPLPPLPSLPSLPPPPPPPEPYEDPVIPCEFCTESLPVYLINEHQERCRRESNLLYPD